MSLNVVRNINYAPCFIAGDVMVLRFVFSDLLFSGGRPIGLYSAVLLRPIGLNYRAREKSSSSCNEEQKSICNE